MTNVTFEMMPSIVAQILENQSALQNQLSEIESFILKNNNTKIKPILTNEEVCEMLSVSRQTLWKWEKENIIKAYGIEKRRYYKYSEIIDLLKPLK